MYLMLNLSLRQQKKSFTLPNVNYISNDSINDPINDPINDSISDPITDPITDPISDLE